MKSIAKFGILTIAGLFLFAWAGLRLMSRGDHRSWLTDSVHVLYNVDEARHNTGSQNPTWEQFTEHAALHYRLSVVEKSDIPLSQLVTDPFIKSFERCGDAWVLKSLFGKDGQLPSGRLQDIIAISEANKDGNMVAVLCADGTVRFEQVADLHP